MSASGLVLRAGGEVVAIPAGGTSMRGHIAALDGVRGLAILLVLGHHFLMNAGEGAGGAAGFVLNAARSGWFGVDLFFVLSGFLITGILVDSRDTQGAVWKFYVRRGLRIFPLYFAVLALGMLAAPLLLTGAMDENLRHARGWLWLYGTNFYEARGGWVTGHYFDFSHLWSLAIEEHFYLIWPWVVLAVPRRRLAGVCAGLAIAATAIRVAYAAAYPQDVNGMYFLTPLRCDGLLLGALLAVVKRDVGLDSLRRPALWILVGGTAVLAAAVGRYGGLPRPSGVDGALVYTGLALMSGALLCVVMTHGQARTVFEHPALRTLGIYSYGLYVFHWLLRPMFLQVMTADALIGHLGVGGAFDMGLLMWIAATVACVAASRRYLEAPMLRLKDRFAAPPARA